MGLSEEKKSNLLSQQEAFIILIILGLISLCGDIIYEGGRSVHGQFLKELGVSAVVVGFVVGAGEFLGYLTRLFSGYIADRYKLHWFFTIIGYLLLISVPLIGFSGNIWWLVVAFIILERIGKGIRGPSRDVIASEAAKAVGSGYGFGISEFIDQIGAITGPMIFGLVFLFYRGRTIDEYNFGYRILLVPFFFLIILLFYAYFRYKSVLQEGREFIAKADRQLLGVSRKFFLLYILFVFFSSAGLISFALAGYHWKHISLVSDSWIAIFYAFVMGIDAIAGLAIGKLYDRLSVKSLFGIITGSDVLILLPILSGSLVFFLFSNNLMFVLLGIVSLGIVLGIQETVMKAVIADKVPLERRGGAYGAYNLVIGLGYLVSGTMCGYLYEHALMALFLFVVMMELFAMFTYTVMRKYSKILHF